MLLLSRSIRGEVGRFAKHAPDETALLGFILFLSFGFVVISGSRTTTVIIKQVQATPPVPRYPMERQNVRPGLTTGVRLVRLGGSS
jgi:hypothetical protein